jgi:hypothetical protein
MTIQWLSLTSEPHDQLVYKSEQGKEWQETNVTCFPLPQTTKYRVHRVELTGLCPNHLYEFKFVDQENIYRFRTLPQN